MYIRTQTSPRLGLGEVEVEALAEGLHHAGPGLEAGAAATLHHFYQEHHTVGVLAASQKALDAQYLRPHAQAF